MIRMVNPVVAGTGPVAGRVPAPVAGPSCRVCGRVLRSEASRARGIGPVCFRASGGRTAIRARAAPTPDDDTPMPGQTELPLPPIQSAFTWSPR